LRDANTTTGLGAADIERCHHRFLQRMSLAGASDVVELQAQVDKLTAQGVFSAAEAAALMWRRCRSSGAARGSEIRANIGRARRNCRSQRGHAEGIGAVDGREGVAGLEDEFVVVQGVADLVVMRESEIWLLDFKTDRLRDGDLAGKYRHIGRNEHLCSSAGGDLWKAGVPALAAFLSARKNGAV